MRIVVLDAHALDPGDNPLSDLASLGDLIIYPRSSPDEFPSRARDADILITNKTPIRREQIMQLPRLKFIAVLATGYDVVDVAAARERNIPVSNVPAYGTDTVAQHTMALILELTNHVGEHARSVAAGEWSSSKDWTYWKHPFIELAGLTLGIVGFGRIGRRVAELGYAFGMKILYSASRPYPHSTISAEHCPLQQLMAQADVISLHCKLTPANRAFVNRDMLSLMKRSAFLINTARGALINEGELAQALRDGLLAGAALDVLSQEPPPTTNPLIAAPNCMITPHMAWSSLSARKRILQNTVASVKGFLAGQPVNVVN